MKVEYIGTAKSFKLKELKSGDVFQVEGYIGPTSVFYLIVHNGLGYKCLSLTSFNICEIDVDDNVILYKSCLTISPLKD